MKLPGETLETEGVFIWSDRDVNHDLLNFESKGLERSVTLIGTMLDQKLEPTYAFI